MTTESSDDLRRRLASAAEDPPPASLWLRVEAGRRRQRRRRRIVAGVAGSALVLGILSLLPWSGFAPQTRGDAPAVAASGSGAPDLLADVRAIDQALQVAYRRGASDDELTPLWNARRQMLARASVTKI